MMKTTIGGAVDSLIAWFMGMDTYMMHKVMGARSGRYAIVAEFERLYGEVEGSLLRYQKFYLIGEFPIELRDRGIC